MRCDPVVEVSRDEASTDGTFSEMVPYKWSVV